MTASSISIRLLWATILVAVWQNAFLSGAHASEPLTTEPHATEPLKVTTRVYGEPKSKLLHHNVTLFSDERIYDLTLVGSNFATVFDTTKSIATLLDNKSKTQTVVSIEQTTEYAAALIERAKIKRMPSHIKAMLASDYEERWEPELQRLTLNSPLLQYQANLVEPVSANVVGRYREFADWSAKLNTVLFGPPPGARLRLNTAIYSKGRVPTEIVRALHTEKQKKPTKVRSVHAYADRWTKVDRQRVDDVENARRTYAHVTLERFRSLPER